MRAFAAAAVLASRLVAAAGAQDVSMAPRPLAPRRRASPRLRASTAASTSAAACTRRTAARPGGQGWRTDYPDADINFSIRLSELTKTHVSRQPDGEPNHFVVRLTDDTLFQCPFVDMEDIGAAEFTDDEVVRLREYLLKGGFLWVRRLLGHSGVGLLGTEHRPRPAACRVSRSSTSPPRSRDLSHAVSGEASCRRSRRSSSGGPRRRDVGTRTRQRSRCMAAASAISTAA